jgi:hypothetical protein
VERVPRRARFWRLAILLPLPYVVFAAFLGSGTGLLENDPLVNPDRRSGVALAVLTLLAGLGFAGLMWARDGRARAAGYLGYALLLTLAFGVGSVAALVSAVGGLHGEGRGSLGFTIALGTGAFLSIVSLVPLAAAVVADWKTPR